MSFQIVNKRALFEYHVEERYVAGMMLTGSEVKSIRDGQVNMAEAYCSFKGEELWLRNMHISPYKPAQHYSHEPLRDRKLLLNKKELSKLKTRNKEKGVTIVPLKITSSETGFIKVEIGLVRGKKNYDKRESIKERDVQRSLRRNED